MTSPSRTRSDRAIAALLFAGSFGYLFVWPHNLGTSDESHFLYHAKVVLEGGLPYRDFFEFYTPQANYLMALLFGVFGVQIATAKIAMAVLHAGIVATLFLGARSLQVRAPLACVGAIAYLALAQPTWPFASPHWIATLVMLWILLTLLRRPLTGSGRLTLGTLSGVLTSMQHQTGVPILAAIVVTIALEARSSSRAGESMDDSIPKKLLQFGVLAVAIPALILLAHLVVVGFAPLFEQLVVHPFSGYRETDRSAWGAVHFVGSGFARYTLPPVLSYLPIALAPIAGWRLFRAWRADDRDGFDRVSTLSVFSLATALTVVNRSDFIHLAFIFAVYLLFTIETIEWGLARLAATRPAGLWVTGTAIALVGLLGLHLQRNYTRAWKNYPLPIETEFGRVDFAKPTQVRLFERVHAALESDPERVLFCYPVYASLYLTANAHNPTPHEIMVPGYLTPKHYRETIEILERERVPLVVVSS